MEKHLVEKKGYQISSKGCIYKSYGAFRISLSFSTNSRLLYLILYSIDPLDFVYIGESRTYIKRGRIIETLEVLQQEIGELRRKVYRKSKKFIKVVNIMYSDLSKLWEKV